VALQESAKAANFYGVDPEAHALLFLFFATDWLVGFVSPVAYGGVVAG
jgi:hypothetical protein